MSNYTSSCNLHVTTVKDGKDKDMKEIYVVFPPMEKNDYPTTFLIPILNNEELRDFVNVHRGNLVDKTGIKVRFQQLQNEGVYTIFGPYYMGLMNDPRTPRVRDKMREVNTLLTVKNELVGHRQLYFNVMVYGDTHNEILMHKEDLDAENSTVFICESAYEPVTADIDILKVKATKFEGLIKSREHFRSVNQVVPVLAGHTWAPDTVSKAQAAGMWTVRTGGDRYRVIRGFCTAARVLSKIAK